MKKQFIAGMATVVACSVAFAAPTAKPGEVRENRAGAHGTTGAQGGTRASEVMMNKAITLTKGMIVEPSELVKVMTSSFEIPIDGKNQTIRGEEIAEGLMKRRESISNDTRLNGAQKDVKDEPVKLAVQMLGMMNKVSTGARPGEAASAAEIQSDTIAARKFIREFAILASTKDANDPALVSHVELAKKMAQVIESFGGRITVDQAFVRALQGGILKGDVATKEQVEAAKKKKEDQLGCLEG